MKDYLNVSGRIFDIQRYSIHDGPGIRTIIFLKGCVLRCRWCCNPESQEYDIQTMMVNGKPKTIGRDVTVGEVMETVVRDMPYYERSGGGITLSGGESLLQPEFAAALLQAAKEIGVNTAMESMGCARFDVIEKVLSYLDLYLMDIKHMDPQKHKEFTGKENTLMLENAKKIAESRKCELIIRVPVIPGFNDTKQELMEIAAFADTLPGVRQIHLLPYHSFGEGKYEGLGRPYLMKGTASIPDEKMDGFRDMIEKHTSLHCRIGG
ncbi:MAG: glycyl-radical enzyme activating protein [Lachnospiraceae bacterium]